MKTFFPFNQLKDISITKKLYFVIGTMAVLIVVELGTLWFSIHTLSAVRALVSAEGLWSKAQKDAAYQLQKYRYSHNAADYEAFQNFMSVPNGDHKTRVELLKPDFDIAIARQGFLEGRVDADDIDGMISMLRRFYRISYISKAIGIWTAGDSMITKLVIIGEILHNEISSGHPSEEILNKIASEIDPLNVQLTQLEDNFSLTLGEGSRWLEHIILKLLFVVALTVEISGLVMSITVSRGITKGLKEITRAANRIKKGDLTDRAAIFARDEIGKVALTMNQMTDQLVQSNKELGQFAYITSHDLQEPLRTITNYTDLFQEDYRGKLGDEGDKYLNSINKATVRMSNLIKDILEYSRIGKNKVFESVDCNKIVNDVLHDLETAIQESNAVINVGKLPVINGYSELRSLFQNLISNAIKYRKKDQQLVIDIGASKGEDEWNFWVKDNGIGIENIYFERIFTIFQKLHSQKEYPGTGIGLANCKKIVELHGGKIWVSSEPNIGSTFYFTIPQIT
jgi:signal transduction histidine kinase